MIRLPIFSSIVFSLILWAGFSQAQTQTQEQVRPQVQTPPFSSVVEIDGRIYLAGHLGDNPQTRELPKGIQAQTKQTLENIGATLATINAGHEDIVRCQVFLADIKDFAKMNEVYRTFFPEYPPARTTVAVSGLAINAKIEIECTAIRGSGVRRRAG